MIAVTALLLILAALFIIVGGLGWAGKLPGNGVIGIRVPEVRKTKELWDTAHRIAGPLWTVSGVVLALGGILSFGASGWMWLVVALAVVGSLALLGMGAGMGAIIVKALVGTAILFLGLSAYVLFTGTNFTFLGGFLFTGIFVVFLAMLGAFVFNMSALSVAASAGFLLISSGYVLYDTSNIIHGEETNYIIATLNLFINIFNMFLSLINILTAFNRN